MLSNLSRRGLAALTTTVVVAGLITLWSTAAPAAPAVLEAESAALSGGARVESEHTGYSGAGYAGGFTDANRGNAKATFTTNATAGQNTLTLRYANGTGSTRTVTLSVNGSVRQVSLPATPGWASWGTVRQSVPLNAAGNSIAVSYGAGDNGNVNLDNITVEPAPVSAGDLEAESAQLSGGARVESEHAGYTGSGYVGGFTDVNRGAATATFTTAGGSAGSSELTLRYANGTGSTRSLSVSVNGAVRQVSLPATSSWAAWGTATAAVTLNAGANTIAISYGAGDSGNVNLDNIRLSTAVPTTTTTTTTNPPGPAGTYELETGFLSGGAVVATSPSGATGTGSVNLPGNGARVIRSINQTRAGNATVTLRHTNSSTRTVTLYVNGVKGAQLTLPGGTGWRTTTHSAALRSGLNLIGYHVTSGDTGGVQLDNIAVTNTAGLAVRGATVPYTTYETESGTGTRIAGRAYTTEAAEASGRSAMKLTGTGQYVQVTLTKPANAITVRAGLPDDASGNGTTAPLAVYVGGTKVRDLALTSKYSWMYGDYPFTAGPGGARPHRYFDDARVLLPQTYPAGTVLRLAKDTNATSYITVDLVEAEVVDGPTTAPAGYLSITDHGARADDGVDDSAALRSAVSAARGNAARGVWIPAGRFTLSSLVQVNGVDVRGAGIWHTVLLGANRRGGFYVNGADTTLADFTFDGDVTTRDPDGAPNSDAFIEGEFGTGSLIFNVAANHAKVGLWIKQADGLLASGMRIRNTMADGLNINGNTANVRVEQSDFRNTGDDALTMWSWESAGTVSRSVFAFNTVALPILANGVAIYGGTDNRAEDNLITDTVFNGSGVMLSTWHASMPFNGTTTVQRNTLTRTGTRNWDWHTHTGAVWLFAERSDITGAVVLRDLEINDSNYHGLLLSWNKAVRDLTVANVRINGTGGATESFDDGAGTVTNANSHGTYFYLMSGTGRFDGVTVSGLKGTGSRGMVNDENRYTVQRGSGNSGW
ncbi:carbohydrate-binding protein [Saccharothrix sp. 6-C]|uniref:CBM35 domain-containing protein n=1 Tax=Saccharothrix sp. 6-C TaxID=2781735 RepID=UPI001917761C|nr:CBM35 domain-containing protein [Saccharothrix sp. 6-C]QQQ79529.1 carbohydrate-binding protein [Saccharothrix sp. 6-C]